MKELQELNPEQLEAVTTTKGPLLVLSGAGTGKTKVLTTRTAYILNQGLASPWNCLAVTFTNKAAKEMTERIYNIIGEPAKQIWIGTFHSLCAKILRKHAPLIGLTSNFTIIDEDDQARLIKNILIEKKIDTQKIKPADIAAIISGFKDKALNFNQVSLNLIKSDNYKIAYDIYPQYILSLKRANCVDFADLILQTINIFNEHNEVLSYYQNLLGYVMVDEYQDTNIAQYLWLKLISAKHKNLCCVGDDDQSIYSWRGAQIQNILRFNQEYPEAKIIRLVQNYRSTANILSSASKLIANNQERLGKELVVATGRNPVNHKITLKSFYNGLEEACFVIEQIQNFIKNGSNPSSLAILVRTASQMREFEEALIKKEVPYKVIGGPKFYERKEIRDVIAYLRLISAPCDDLAFLRIINLPKRGFGGVFLEKLRLKSQQKNQPLFQSLNEMINNNEIKGKTKETATDFIKLITENNEKIITKSAAIIAKEVLENSGYLNMWREDNSIEAQGRLENINELLEILSSGFEGFTDFLEHVSLLSENSEKDGVIEDKVSLMTMHSAKGLEFNSVFLPGWEDNLFPHSRAILEQGQKGLEEERRLAYVAITRAKEKVFISFCANRLLYGKIQSNLPSQFISELDKESIADIYKPPSLQQMQQKINNSTRDNFINSASAWRPGSKVKHESFGEGIIVRIDGDKIEIAFQKSGLKKIMKNFVTLL